LVVFLKQW